jgi:cytochrome c biogenesis protein CcmG, thiol:disulfide interchange protein DsbE
MTRIAAGRRSWRLALVVLVAMAGAACGDQSAHPQDGEKGPTLAPCPVGEGTPIVGIETTTLPCLGNSGQSVSVTAVHGRPAVINVWASWCPPCRSEAGILEAARRAAGDQIQFIGVDSRDTRAAARRFLADSGVSYPQVFDDAGIFAARAGVPGLPFTLVVDASGHIVYQVVGELTADRLRYGLSRLPEGEHK